MQTIDPLKWHNRYTKAVSILRCHRVAVDILLNLTSKSSETEIKQAVRLQICDEAALIFRLRYLECDSGMLARLKSRLDRSRILIQCG